MPAMRTCHAAANGKCVRRFGHKQHSRVGLGSFTGGATPLPYDSHRHTSLTSYRMFAKSEHLRYDRKQDEIEFAIRVNFEQRKTKNVACSETATA
jgi:hypothetical protein